MLTHEKASLKPNPLIIITVKSRYAKYSSRPEVEF